MSFDYGKEGESGWEGVDHYHIWNPFSTNNNDKYLDIYGNAVRKGHDKSHIEPIKFSN